MQELLTLVDSFDVLTGFVARPLADLQMIRNSGSYQSQPRPVLTNIIRNICFLTLVN